MNSKASSSQVRIILLPIARKYNQTDEIVSIIELFIIPTCSTRRKMCDGTRMRCDTLVLHNDPTKEGYCSDECWSYDRKRLVLDFMLAHVNYDRESDLYLLHGCGFACPHCRRYILTSSIPLVKNEETYIHLYQHFLGLCPLQHPSDCLRSYLLSESVNTKNFLMCTKVFRIPPDTKRYCVHKGAQHG